MRYENITRGTFFDRPNRFIARVAIDGTVGTVHVKNTGRCRELLLLVSGDYFRRNPLKILESYDVECRFVHGVGAKAAQRS